MKKDWLNDGLMDGIVASAHRAATLDVDRDARFFMTLAVMDGAAESPIELRLLTALAFMRADGLRMEVQCDVWRSPGKNWAGVLDHMRSGKDYGWMRPLYMQVHPQVQIEEFRVDMVAAVVLPDGKVGGIAIECDGHDHHYNTKEKVSKDRARDRRLQNLGFTILRFTGSDIHADAVKCALEVFETANRLMTAHMRYVA